MYQKRNKELDVVGLFLSGYNEQFYLREISKLAKLPLKTTQDLTAHLEQTSILKSLVKGKNKYFQLNQDNFKTKLYLLLAEVHRTILFLDKYPVFKPFMKEIKADIPLIVFGSFAGFRESEASDIDLMVISKEEQELPFHLLPYTIHKIELSETSFSKALEKQETLLKEIEKKHVILNNHSFYVNRMWKFYGRQ